MTTSCGIPGCERAYCARGWCRMHWQRWRRTGNPLVDGRTVTVPVLDRVLAATERRGDCLIYTGAPTSNGYGSVGENNRKRRAHRVVCEAIHGPPPSPEHMALHSCDTPLCVEATHLRWGTPAENNDDMVRRGRAAHGIRRLTEDEVRQIRALVARGASIQALADRFDMAASHISRIANRHRWKTVT